MCACAGARVTSQGERGFTSHVTSLDDHSFQTLKSKEVRDAGSPPPAAPTAPRAHKCSGLYRGYGVAVTNKHNP